MTTTISDGETLYQAIASGDSAAMHAAYEALWPYLCRVALNIVADQENAADLAEECAQQGMIRIHEQFAQCKEPKAFKAWSRRIVSNAALDLLRRRKRLDFSLDSDATQSEQVASTVPTPDVALETVEADSSLADLLANAPISDRSRRVVVGRFLHEQPDEQLAAAESELSGREVLPSHVQVTRAKNIAKLRQWAPLRAIWQTG